MGALGCDTGIQSVVLYGGIKLGHRLASGSCYSSFPISPFLNVIINGQSTDDKLFSENKFTNASDLSCPLGNRKNRHTGNRENRHTGNRENRHAVNRENRHTGNKENRERGHRGQREQIRGE